jgi:hypothetical protein
VDTLGIIRQIEADAGLRAQLRAVLLGDELLTLPARMDRVEKVLERLADAQQRTEAELAKLAGEVKVRLDRLEADVAQLKGSDLEQRLQRDPVRYLGEHFERIKVLQGDAFEDLIAALEKRDHLEPGELRRLRQADLLADARLSETTTRVTVVGEVSVTLHSDDVRRAAEAAGSLSRRGSNAVAIVAGADLGGPALGAEAERAGVLVFEIA